MERKNLLLLIIYVEITLFRLVWFHIQAEKRNESRKEKNLRPSRTE